MFQATSTEAIKKVKPLLRGWSHLVAFVISLATGVWLVVFAPSPAAKIVAAIYTLSLSMLFGISALYHRPQWGPQKRAFIRRLDHSAIFVLIAGSYTPFSQLLPEQSRHTILWLAWGGAIAGCLQAIFWIRAPKWITAILYVALGWAVVWFLPELYQALGLTSMILLALGGLFYTVGAVVYALHRPDPWPTVFGYHEIFHSLVILAAIAQFVAVVRVIPRIF